MFGKLNIERNPGYYTFKNNFTKTIILIILIIGSIIVIYPLFFMIMNSFKPGSLIISEAWSLPKKLDFRSYSEVLKKFTMATYFYNSVFISGMVTVLNVLFSSMVAYGISKTRIPGKKFLFNMILGSMMVPAILLLAPTYSMMYHWGWINTYRVLIIPGAISAYNIFLMIQFMSQINNAYIEAAQVDGANDIQIFFRVVLPMSLPGTATIAILTFIGSWNDLFNPLLYMRDNAHYTLQVAIMNLNQGLPGEFLGQLFAALAMSTAPIFFVFFFLQRYIMKAYSGGVKL